LLNLIIERIISWDSDDLRCYGPNKLKLQFYLLKEKSMGGWVHFQEIQDGEKHVVLEIFQRQIHRIYKKNF
jgi:nicotinamide riboside kinase